MIDLIILGILLLGAIFLFALINDFLEKVLIIMGAVIIYLGIISSLYLIGEKGFFVIQFAVIALIFNIAYRAADRKGYPWKGPFLICICILITTLISGVAYDIIGRTNIINYLFIIPLQIMFIGFVAAILSFGINVVLKENRIGSNTFFIISVCFAVVSFLTLPLSLRGYDSINNNIQDLQFLLVTNGFLELMLGLLICIVIVSIILNYMIYHYNGNGSSTAIFGIIIILAPSAYFFMTDYPYIQIDKIDSVIIGDDILVKGYTNRLNENSVTITLHDAGGKQIYQNNIWIKDERFVTTINTKNFYDGLYSLNIEAGRISKIEEISVKIGNLKDVSIYPQEVILGNPLEVSASIGNSDNKVSSVNLNMKLDGNIIQSKPISIQPNSIEIVKFNIDSKNAGVGKHTINIGGQEAIFIVKPVPFLRLNSISGDLGIGKDLTITGNSNLPDGTSILITVKNTDSELARQTATINSGSFSSAISTTDAKEGIYTIKADDLSGATDTTTITFIKFKADLVVVGLSVNPSEPIIGESATITITVKNNGNIEGTRNVELKVDGLVRQSKPITIQANSIKEVQFTIQEDVGLHNIEIDGYTKSLIVKVKPVIQLNKISNVRVGQDLTISGTTNMPDNTKILVTAKSGDASLISQSTFAKDGSFSATFTTADAKEGIYTIKAEDSKGIYDTTSLLISTEIPELNYDLSVSPKDVTPDGTVTASVTIKNNVNIVKDVVLNLKVDDQIRQSQTISIPSNSIKVVSFDIKNEKVGSHIIDVNGYVTSYSVSAPAPITVTDISTNELRIQLRSDKTIISKNENIFLTLSAINKITNTKDVHLQVILVIPSGLSTTETSFAKSGVGQYVSDSIIKSGESRTEYINVGVMPNQIGTFTITGEVIYYFGDDRNNGGTQKISLPITVVG